VAASQEMAEEAVQVKSEEEVTVEWTAGDAEAVEAAEAAAIKKSIREIHSVSTSMYHFLIFNCHGIIRCQIFSFLIITMLNLLIYTIQLISCHPVTCKTFFVLNQERIVKSFALYL